jgi:hypothetical protein
MFRTLICVFNKYLQFLIFKQHLEKYKAPNGVVVGVNPLCGSRTFEYLAAKGVIRKVGHETITTLIVVRNEEERILSAYNKKIVSQSDWKKVVLRRLNGMKQGMSFTDFMCVLIRRKSHGYFIDKHFRPCTKQGGSLMNITDTYFLEKTLGIEEKSLMNTKVKSSESVMPKGVSAKKNLTARESKLFKRYIGSYEQ